HPRGEAVILQQLHQPPPPERRVDRRGRAGRPPADHPQDRLHPVRHVPVRQHLAILIDDRHLRALAVNVDSDVNRHHRASFPELAYTRSLRCRAEQGKGVRPYARPSQIRVRSVSSRESISGAVLSAAHAWRITTVTYSLLLAVFE